MATTAENADPNLSIASGSRGHSHSPAKAAAVLGTKPPLSKKRVSFSPKKLAILSPGGSRARNGRRRSSSHFSTAGERTPGGADDAKEDDDSSSDIEFTLDGAAGIVGRDGGGEMTTLTTIDTSASTAMAAAAMSKMKNDKPQQQQRRRRRSSSRFLQLSSGGIADDDEDVTAEGDSTRPGEDGDDNLTSSEHLGEIYRQAIRMNAENKINAGNSWGFKLIENMDKFIVEDAGNNTGSGDGDGNSPRNDGRDDLRAARQMKSRDDKGRVNFAKASCTLDASVKIYSYRVDDVHLSSFRVLANLNRSDNKKDDDVHRIDEIGGEEDVGEKVVKRKSGPKGPTETLETNLGRSSVVIEKLLDLFMPMLIFDKHALSIVTFPHNSQHQHVQA